VAFFAMRGVSSVLLAVFRAAVRTLPHKRLSGSIRTFVQIDIVDISIDAINDAAQKLGRMA
jgi:hypothetical protein